MFSDLRGFTALSDTASETDVLDTLNGYFDAVVNAVEDNGGDVLKFMGDGVLSIFAVDDPDSRTDRHKQSVRAALDALAAIATLNDTRTRSGKPALDIGIGLNAGEVSYGNIGSPGRLDFTVLGSAVNIASRIESLTKTAGYRVLTTAAIADTNPDRFVDLGHREVRGLKDPIVLYGLLEP